MAQTSEQNRGINNSPAPTNEAIAVRFERIAELLDAQHANPYRVNAYRAAAAILRELHVPVVRLLRLEGLPGLRKLPGIGDSLSRSIAQLIGTGSLGLLDQLQGEVAAEQVLGTVAGIGPKLASRIHEQLGIENLRDLYAASVDGRLGTVPGFGQTRVRAVREMLQGRLPRMPQSRYMGAGKDMPNTPKVDELLDVDTEYRHKAEHDELLKIAPRRFNPSNTAWLPILHTERNGNHYTVVFSNTSRAHELNTTHDWVVIYRDEVSGGGQWTVVTQSTGRLASKRVVRGRERECELMYARELAGNENDEPEPVEPEAAINTPEQLALIRA